MTNGNNSAKAIQKGVAKIQLNPQMNAKAGGLPLVYGLIFPEGDVTDARPL
jgi:hypothetical protein